MEYESQSSSQSHRQVRTIHRMVLCTLDVHESLQRLDSRSYADQIRQVHLILRTHLSNLACSEGKE